jgi:hypothetical protein
VGREGDRRTGRPTTHLAEVNEEPTSVTITIVVTTPRHEDCGLAAIRDQVTAHLDKPVGSRRLLDGALTS